MMPDSSSGGAPSGGYTFTTNFGAGGGGGASGAAAFSGGGSGAKKLGGAGASSNAHGTHYGLYGSNTTTSGGGGGAAAAGGGGPLHRQLPALGVTGSSATSIFASPNLYVNGAGGGGGSMMGSGGGGGGSNPSSSHHQPSPYAMPVGGIGSSGAGGAASTSSHAHGLGLTYKKKATTKKVSNVSSMGLPSYMPSSSSQGQQLQSSSEHGGHGPNSMYAAPAGPSFGVTGVAAGTRYPAGGVGATSSSEGTRNRR
jgi:hypothetical protein